MEKEKKDMKLKKLIARVLSAALLCSLLTAVPASAAEQGGFRDISDPAVAEAAELLRLMGVVEGDGEGYFHPSLTLNRAQFCKMAVLLRGEGKQANAQANRTIFLDVKGDHWARGYINYASSITVGESERLVMGVGDGTFHPDEEIAFAQAVTMAMRLLGYTSADVNTGAVWYDGYMAAADTAGVLDGLNADPNAPVTRAQAAILFQNLLFASPKGSKESFLTSMGGSEVKDAIILSVNAEASDGTPGAVKTTSETYKTDRTFSSSILGRQGKLILDADGKVVAFVPDENANDRSVIVSSAQSNYLIASGGERIDVEPDTKVYRGENSTSWKDDFHNAQGKSVTLHYAASGKLSYIYVASSASASSTVRVARTNPNGSNPFASMASGASLVKNGLPATADDLRPWDVATYNASSRTIQVSDLKLTGIYESASPSPASPLEITVMGRTFPLLSTAWSDLASFKIGDRITLLLTVEGDVAGAVSASTVSGNAVGVVEKIEEFGSGDNKKYEATVKLLQGDLTVEGEVSSTAARLNGQLVIVSSSSIRKLTLSAVSGVSVSGNLNVAQHKLGSREIAGNVIIYERVGTGPLTPISYEDITAVTIPQSKISYAATDYAGRVNYLVLSDATGDCYEYGFLHVESTTGRDDFGDFTTETAYVRQGDASGNEIKSTPAPFIGMIRGGVAGGVAFSADKSRIVGSVTLESITKVSRSAFDVDNMPVTVGGVIYPIAEEVQCYNKSARSWFEPGETGMEKARAYSETLTIYFDRAPEEGGKVRMIAAE